LDGKEVSGEEAVSQVILDYYSNLYVKEQNQEPTLLFFGVLSLLLRIKSYGSSILFWWNKFWGL